MQNPFPSTNRLTIKVRYHRLCCATSCMEETFLISDTQVKIGDLRNSIWTHFRGKLAITNAYPSTIGMGSQKQAEYLQQCQLIAEQTFNGSPDAGQSRFFQSQASQALCCLSYFYSKADVITELQLDWNRTLQSYIPPNFASHTYLQLYLCDMTDIFSHSEHGTVLAGEIAPAFPTAPVFISMPVPQMQSLAPPRLPPAPPPSRGRIMSFTTYTSKAASGSVASRDASPVRKML